MTPAEQYRKLANRLNAILEQDSTPTPGDESKPGPNGWSGPPTTGGGEGSPWPTSNVPKTEPEPISKPEPKVPNPAMAQLQQRCQSLVSKLSQYATAASDQQTISKIKVTIVDDPEDDDMYSYVLRGEIVLDYNQWNDAPDNVLLWSLGHEAGHICLVHRSKGNTPQQLQQQELAADQFGTRLCLAMGITAAPAFKWANDKRDRLMKYPVGSHHQFKLNLQNNPDDADAHQNRTHPTYQQRFDHAAQDKFELSKVDTDQLDRFTAHMSRVA